MTMSESSNAAELAIEAVARRFSAPWQNGEGPPDAYVTVHGRRIALDVAVMAESRPRRKTVARARLREDAVAQRVLRGIEDALRAHVPDGKTIILNIGAPIRVPNRLLSALTSILLPYLESGVEEVDERKAILGNRVRFRVVSHDSKWAAKVIGFVFTGDPEPGDVANAMRSLHDEIAAKAKRRMPGGFAGDRWLVLDDERGIADIKTYRQAYSLLSSPNHFRKILMVFEGGRVDTLAEIGAK